MAETVLVTGASGYIATHVVRQLLQAGEYKVRGTVRSTKNEEKIAPLKNLCPDAKYPLELVEGDLSDEAPWADAVKDCTYVLHTASPFPAAQPKNEDEIIKPAVDGTLFILRACRAAGTVKRVVLTSSVAAISTGFDVGGKYSEKDWTDANKRDLMPYLKSKTLAEKAAWDYMKELKDDEKFELAVMNPTLVLGPVLCGGLTSSQEVPKRLLQHEMPMVPKLNFPIIDVRDVAKAHINAITVPEAAGNRHILWSGNLWFSEMAKILEEEFKPQGYKIPTKEAPNCLIKLSGLLDKSIKATTPSLSKTTEYETDRLTKVLGITPIDKKQTVIDMAYSMIDSGKVKKTDGYTGPKTPYL